MVELARRARFGHEAKRRVFVGEQVGMDDLHRDGAAERALLRAIHATHAPDADEIEDVMAAGQRLSDELVDRRANRADGKAARRAILVFERAARAAVRADSQQGLRGRHVRERSGASPAF